MTNNLLVKTTVCLLCLGLAAGIYAQSEPLPKAPDFTLPFIRDKGSLTLSEILPQKDFTILIFFDSRCAECMEKVAQLRDLPEELEKKGFSAQVLGINTDSEGLGRIRSFVKGECISFPVLSDTFGWTTDLYNCSPYSFSYFMVDREGLLRDYHLDQAPDIRERIFSSLGKAVR